MDVDSFVHLALKREVNESPKTVKRGGQALKLKQEKNETMLKMSHVLVLL